MEDLEVTPQGKLEEPGCDATAGDCGTSLSLPYFFSYQIIGSFVMINLVVGVIIENFSMIGKQSPDLVSHNDIENFREVLDALIAANYSSQLDEGLPTGDDASGARAVLEKRKSSLSSEDIPLPGQEDGAAPLTARRKGLARAFANKLLSMAV